MIRSALTSKYSQRAGRQRTHVCHSQFKLEDARHPRVVRGNNRQVARPFEPDPYTRTAHDSRDAGDAPTRLERGSSTVSEIRPIVSLHDRRAFCTVVTELREARFEGNAAAVSPRKLCELQISCWTQLSSIIEKLDSLLAQHAAAAIDHGGCCCLNKMH